MVIISITRANFGQLCYIFSSSAMILSLQSIFVPPLRVGPKILCRAKIIAGELKIYHNCPHCSCYCYIAIIFSCLYIDRQNVCLLKKTFIWKIHYNPFTRKAIFRDADWLNWLYSLLLLISNLGYFPIFPPKKLSANFSGSI